MEAPKYCLEAVAIWDKTKIQKNGLVKSFCAYGATEYGTESDAVKVLDLSATAFLDLADQLTRFSRMISHAGQAANN